MKTILVGYDETEVSKRALDRAAELAKALGAKLIVTSVAPLQRDAGRGMGPIDPTDPPARHQEELAHAREAVRARGLDAECVMALGDPASAIVMLADERKADLIVVGSRHAGFFEHLLRPSVSHAVSQHAHGDVLIVH
jgi:nucleotide-binding universal stress UspA family protein